MATVTVRDAAELGAAIRDARLLAHMSQVELAADADVGRQWLNALEAGDKQSPPFDMLLRILRVLDLHVDIDPTPRPRPAQTSVPQISASELLLRHTQQR